MLVINKLCWDQVSVRWMVMTSIQFENHPWSNDQINCVLVWTQWSSQPFWSNPTNHPHSFWVQAPCKSFEMIWFSGQYKMWTENVRDRKKWLGTKNYLLFIVCAWTQLLQKYRVSHLAPSLESVTWIWNVKSDRIRGYSPCSGWSTTTERRLPRERSSTNGGFSSRWVIGYFGIGKFQF